ncbi:LysR family transcriptional regulator [Variovorax sp. J31P179]|uniref:LysR family transcriptional regulator n=1 Tax=Variovorax sp. J31P179 TaxID=3053508 RepID=UPI0025777268|nr:LysR family transcriptional regulator [Variovorax sp. J31P179]MDM0085401.1 LysR family transcriptional regulator [Variovorax sp. J31P179]
MDRITAAEVFLTIAARGSLSATADALSMSRPMVTRYLAELEGWVGSRLLHRTTRKLSLTPAGEEMLVHCQRILDVAADMVSLSSRSEEGPRGVLRIACSQSLAQEVLSVAVAEYLRVFPLVTVDFSIGARAVNLVEERIDLAIRITNDIDPNLIARPLAQCASAICASPAWVAKHGLPRRPHDLSARNCLTYSHFGKSLWEFSHANERIAVPVGGNLSANEPQVLLAAALEGVGITMQPLYAVSRLITEGKLVPLLPGFAPQTLGVYGILASRRQVSAALRAMIDFLASWFQDPSRWVTAVPAASRSEKPVRSKRT